MSVVHGVLFSALRATAQRLVRVLDRWRERQHTGGHVAVRAGLSRRRIKENQLVHRHTVTAFRALCNNEIAVDRSGSAEKRMNVTPDLSVTTHNVLF